MAQRRRNLCAGLLPQSPPKPGLGQAAVGRLGFRPGMGDAWWDSAT